jgi:hypothetical protein
MLFVGLRFTPDGLPLGMGPSSDSGTNAIAVPTIDGALWDVSSDARWRGGSIGTLQWDATPSAPIDLAFAPGIELTSPNDGATDVTLDTPLTWTAPSGSGPCAIRVFANANASSNDHIVELMIFAAEQAHLPDLTQLGRSYGAGQNYGWSASWDSRFSSVDDIARLGAEAQHPARTQLAGTASRTFTTRGP